jgi:protein-disulfide isomerase
VKFHSLIILFVLFSLFSLTNILNVLGEWKLPKPISSNIFLKYENSHVGYTIEYPENWNISESNYNAIFYPSIEERKILEKQQPSIYLTIANTSLPNVPISLESIVDETIKNLKSTIINFKLIESTSMLLNVDNNYAHKLVYSYNAFNKSITNMDIGLIANNNLFLLSFSSFSDNYNIYLPTIEKMIESFSPYTDAQNIINKLFSPVSANASALGDKKANITIVEFADYQCPFCAKFHKETKDSIMQNFVDTGEVKFLFKDLIVNDLQKDKSSTLAAVASYCAAEQGKYWEYNDELYKNSEDENTGWVTKDNLKQFANNIGIANIMKFSDCVDSEKYENIVNENNSLAKNIGLTSTPTFIFYNGTTPVAVQGAQPYELFEQIINEMK